jgi:hypothetical protein
MDDLLCQETILAHLISTSFGLCHECYPHLNNETPETYMNKTTSHTFSGN